MHKVLRILNAGISMKCKLNFANKKFHDRSLIKLTRYRNVLNGKYCEHILPVPTCSLCEST